MPVSIVPGAEQHAGSIWYAQTFRAPSPPIARLHRSLTVAARARSPCAACLHAWRAWHCGFDKQQQQRCRRRHHSDPPPGPRAECTTCVSVDVKEEGEGLWRRRREVREEAGDGKKARHIKGEDIMGGGGSDAEEIFKRDVKEEKRGRL